MLRSRLIAAFLALILGMQSWTTLAQAQPSTSKKDTNLAILGFRSGKSLREEKIRKILTEQVETSRIHVLADVDVSTKLQEQSGTLDPKSEASVKSAYEHFNAGQQYYWKLDLTNALKEFNLAVRGYREGISILRDNYYLLFSHLYLGITLHFLGRVDEGKKFIQEMVMLDQQRKTRVLPQRDFPPKIVDLHKQIMQEIVSKPLSTLSVDSVPSGAKVIFDGSEVGQTPMHIKDVPPGQHFLGLDLAGYQMYGSPIEINAGPQNFITSLKEKNTFKVYSDENQTQSTIAELKAIANALDADVLVLGQTGTSDSETVQILSQIFVASTGSFSEVFEEKINAKKLKFQSLPEKIKNAVKNREMEPEPLALNKEVKKETPVPEQKIIASQQQQNISDFDKGEPEKKTEQGKPLYKKWWFWGVIGAVAVGAGATVFVFGNQGADSNVLTFSNPL